MKRLEGEEEGIEEEKSLFRQSNKCTVMEALIWLVV